MDLIHGLAWLQPAGEGAFAMLAVCWWRWRRPRFRGNRRQP